MEPATMSGTIRTGVGGWTFEPWRGVFYPDTLKQKDELDYMSRQLLSIDINAAVYTAEASAMNGDWNLLSVVEGRFQIEVTHQS
jgi:uncharacterized protein YecE (DUF72 family)